MHIPDPLGVVGAPQQTLRALEAALADLDLSGAALVLLTDRQGERGTARYAVLVRAGDAAYLTVDAFGPRFGADGTAALRDLARWALGRGVTNVRETVVNPPDFARVTREPDADEVRRLLAASNPSDPNIYLG